MKTSIILSTRDRADLLALTLPSLASQTCPATEYEIIIVDNGSADHTEAVVARAARTYTSRTFRYIFHPLAGQHRAWHRGMQEAEGELLVFVDDDIDADSGWLQAIIDTFADPQIKLVGGPSRPRYEVPPPDWLDAFWSHKDNGRHSCGYLSLVDLGDKPFEMENPNYIWGLNFSIRKATLELLGGFNPCSMPWELRRFRGDGESAVTRRAKAYGLKAGYQPKALVYHRIPKSRLTVEYFERRSYLQGIDDSFRDIRAHRAPISTEPARTWLHGKAHLLGTKRLAKHTLRFLRFMADDPYEEIKYKVRVAYEAGYQYHQDEVRKDPELLGWVLKPNYCDEAIPLGR